VTQNYSNRSIKGVIFVVTHPVPRSEAMAVHPQKYAKMFRERGLSVRFVALLYRLARSPFHWRLYTWDGIPVIEAGPARWFYALSNLPRESGWVIQTEANGAQLRLWAWSKWHRRPPTVYDVHSLIQFEPRRRLTWRDRLSITLEPLTCHAADALVCLGEGVRSYYMNQYQYLRKVRFQLLQGSLWATKRLVQLHRCL